MKRVPVDPKTLAPADSIERFVIPDNEAGRHLVRLLIDFGLERIAARRAAERETVTA